MSLTVLLTSTQCRNKDLATLSWMYCPHYGSSFLVLPNEHFHRLTQKDPYQENDFSSYNFGYANIKIKSEWQTRFANVLDKLSHSNA